MCPKCKKPVTLDHTYRIVDRNTVEHTDCENPELGQGLLGVKLVPELKESKY
jgi:hypothetical protein